MEFSSERLKQLAGIISESTEHLKEDWADYQSLEEIELKYLQKLMLALGISEVDNRLPQIKEIFSTALKDAEMLGKLSK